MVVSKLNNLLNYPENILVDENDIDYESYIYKGNIYGKPILFIFGKGELVSNNLVLNQDVDIMYINVYLVKNNDIVRKIGIFEILNSEYLNYLDDEGNINLSSELGNQMFKTNSIMFSGSKDFIKKIYNLDEIKETIDSESSDDEDEDDLDEDLDEDEDLDKEDDDLDEEDHDLKEELQPPSKKSPIQKTLATKEDYIKEVEEYKKIGKKLGDKWINEYLESKKYDIKDVPGDGNCFFTCFVEAYNSHYSIKDDLTGKKLSTQKVRNYLASIADEDLFNFYKGMLTSFRESSQEAGASIAKKRKIHESLKIQIGGTSSLQDKQGLVSRARKNIEAIGGAKSILEASNEIKKEFDYMAKIKDLNEFKEYIKTSDYYADSWAIPKLEAHYNVKFIIFSQTNYEKEDYTNIILCNETEESIEKKGYFDPLMYINVIYSSNIHYDLITHDKNYYKSSFDFIELPYIIKLKIAETCMTKGVGIYNLIKDFNDFALEEGTIIGKQLSSKEEFVKSVQELKSSEKSESGDKSLCNQDILIVISSRAAHLEFGRGNHETISTSLKLAQSSKNPAKIPEKHRMLQASGELIKIKDWRKKLDNSWSQDLKLNIDGKDYASVNEYIKKNPENMMKALEAKYEQNPDLKEILKKTGNACIQIYKLGRLSAGDTSRFSEATELMTLRKNYLKK